MLPDLPSVQALNQFPILQQWIGLASLILVAFGIYVSIRKMNRDDRTAANQVAAVENPLANMPKYYMEGPIIKAFQILENIQAMVKEMSEGIDDIQKKIDAIHTADDDRRRRR